MSNTYSEMSESAEKRRKRYVDYTKGNYKPTCLIHGPRNAPDKYRVLEEFGSKYAKIRHTNNRGKNPQIEMNIPGSNIMLLLIVQLMKSSCKKIIK